MTFLMTKRIEAVTKDVKPLFSKAYSNANEILVSSEIISTFPFCPKKLVKEQTPIVCRSFSKALSYGLDIRDLGSESAIITQLRDKSIIFYNDNKPESHIAYSIIHELGHYINGHNMQISDEDIYHRYEIETNYFAAQILMPEQIIREFQRRKVAITVPFIQKCFGVSQQAAEKRISTLAKTNYDWKSRAEKEFDDIILFKYSEFINSIAPLKTNAYDLEYEYEKQKERSRWY